jgi:hypothetical protein
MNIKPAPNRGIDVLASEIQVDDIVLGFEGCGPVTGVESHPVESHPGVVRLRWGSRAHVPVLFATNETRQVSPLGRPAAGAR